MPYLGQSESEYQGLMSEALLGISIISCVISSISRIAFAVLKNPFREGLLVKAFTWFPHWDVHSITGIIRLGRQLPR